MDRPHSVSVAGVIVDAQNRALLIQRRDNGKWEPPGGVLEREETIPEALQREVLEETGIKIALPATLTGVYKNMKGLIVSLVFRCQAADGTPTQSGFRQRGPAVLYATPALSRRSISSRMPSRRRISERTARS